MQIRKMTSDDWQQVQRIYQDGIQTGIATFETHVPDWESWDRAHLDVGRLVAEDGKRILGWVALSPVSSRCIYGGVAEVSVYIGPASRGKGVGFKLMSELVEISESEGFWTLQAGLFPENKASLALHKKSGFRVIGFREKIGRLNGLWRDNVILERRSKLVGVT